MIVMKTKSDWSIVQYAEGLVPESSGLPTSLVQVVT